MRRPNRGRTKCSSAPNAAFSMPTHEGRINEGICCSVRERDRPDRQDRGTERETLTDRMRLRQREIERQSLRRSTLSNLNLPLVLTLDT